MKASTLMTIYLLASLLLVTSCKRNQFRVDISSIRADIEIKRLEHDLFADDPGKIKDNLPALKEKYGSFLQLFSYVINTGFINDTAFADLLTSFCTDKQNFEVYTSVSADYSEIGYIREGLENAFRHYKYYFPGKPVPSVFTCITGFNNSIIVADSAIGISLDKYLGRDCVYYKRLQIYSYMAANMNSWNIVPDCIYAWGATEWDFEHVGYPSANVLSRMIHEGKLKYFEKCMIPQINDTLLFGFSGDQMKFCRNNESQMWTYLIENNLLFSSDNLVVRKLTGEAPYTSYFTNESPGKAAVWLGFRIIESYMKRNRDVSIPEIMDKTDIQAILDGAKYYPR